MSGPLTSLSAEAVYKALDTVKDPCMSAAGLDLSIVDLGLVYGVEIDGGVVKVEMTFTEIGCVFTHVIGAGVHDAVEALPGVESVELIPHWLPLWTEERLNEKAARALARNRNTMIGKLKRKSLPLAMSGSAAPKGDRPTSS